MLRVLSSEAFCCLFSFYVFLRMFLVLHPSPFLEYTHTRWSPWQVSTCIRRGNHVKVDLFQCYLCWGRSCEKEICNPFSAGPHVLSPCLMQHLIHCCHHLYCLQLMNLLVLSLKFLVKQGQPRKAQMRLYQDGMPIAISNLKKKS